jgi:hypothetical protein
VILIGSEFKGRLLNERRPLTETRIVAVLSHAMQAFWDIEI